VIGLHAQLEKPFKTDGFGRSCRNLSFGPQSIIGFLFGIEVPISATNTLPHDVRLVAAVSRIIDLHQSRREQTGVYVPETQERAGYLLSISFLLLDVLRELEMERGPSFVSSGEVLSAIRKRVSTVSAEDMDFVVDSLAHEREIRYGVEDGKGGITFGLTKETTPLIEKARGFAQIQLTENARLLLRVSAMKESWLYSDIDAEKLVKAIERGQFSDIPRFCKMMVLEIASKNKQLSSALERPTFAELRDMLIADGPGIANSLRDASEVVKQACSRIFDARTREDFEMWKARNPVPYEIGNLQTEIELVMQNVEALSRRFVGFLDTAQRARSTGGEGIPFMSIVDSMTAPVSVPDSQRLEAILSELMPWGVRSGFFHPSQMVGAVDFTSLDEGEKHVPVSTFNLEPDHIASHSRLMDFILRNRAMVIDRLKARPTTFSEMISEVGFLLEADETPADFFGVYSAPEHLDGEGFRIVVGITGETFDTRIVGLHFSGSDPLMFLTEVNA